MVRSASPTMTRMTPPRLPRQSEFPAATPNTSRDHRGAFGCWQTVPPTTALSDLYTTSLLIVSQGQPSGVLVRCTAGMDEGSAVLVHADTSRPNAVRLLEMDDDAHIGEQARGLASHGLVQVLVIPHITWQHPGTGVPWRTPAAILIALVAALAVIMLGPPLSVAATLPVAAVTGSLAWLLLRGRVPTSIAPVDDMPMAVQGIVGHIMPRMGQLGSSHQLASGSTP